MISVPDATVFFSRMNLSATRKRKREFKTVAFEKRPVAQQFIRAAIRHDPDSYIKFITDEIREAIGEEQDPLRASCLNVCHSLRRIEESLAIRADEEQGLRLVGALYELQSGRVRFLNEEGSLCD